MSIFMSRMTLEFAPQPEETLAQYVVRLRGHLNLSQMQVSQAAGIHRQTLGKIEHGQTLRLNQRARNGLAYALSIPIEYLDAASKGEPLPRVGGLKLCPRCWVSGTAPDPMWMDLRSKFCFACGTGLRDRCTQCGEPMTTLRHRFCGSCGASYQET
jgi:DNA-binding XRE family transcriptional regulator